MGEQDADHQLDDFARREMVASLFIGLFVETPDQIFEQVTHFDVRDAIRVQVDGCNLLDHLKQAIGFVQLLDFFIEFELLDDFPRPRRKTGDVVVQVGRQFIGITQQVLEGKFTGVVETELEAMIDHRLDGFGVVLAIGLKLAVIVDHLLLAALQHAIETAKHGQRNHYPAILGRTVGTTQKIGDVPDHIALLFERFVVFHRMFFSRNIRSHKQACVKMKMVFQKTERGLVSLFLGFVALFA
ncbi:hypothetical protein SDC9_157170 [bioreactor metagenome]|uniref:Uncharacterized protein n=1 Tax=bioreactor metagenome TaxID=1076179 RepID=A0A645F6R3_9ZZZZ